MAKSWKAHDEYAYPYKRWQIFEIRTGTPNFSIALLLNSPLQFWDSTAWQHNHWRLLTGTWKKLFCVENNGILNKILSVFTVNLRWRLRPIPISGQDKSAPAKKNRTCNCNSRLKAVWGQSRPEQVWSQKFSTTWRCGRRRWSPEGRSRGWIDNRGNTWDKIIRCKLVGLWVLCRI